LQPQAELYPLAPYHVTFNRRLVAAQLWFAMHILVVDDHPPICEVLSQYLEKIGPQLSGTTITVNSVGTLREAQALVSAEHHPDLVFLDLTLEDDNQGAITFERFQKSNDTYKIPVVIYTGLSLAQAGAADTLL
jgi:CheY-like chemotaxis protein